MLRSPAKGRSCLGKALRDSGHKRVPEPPERITGVMEEIVLLMATKMRQGASQGKKADAAPLLYATFQIPTAWGANLRIAKGLALQMALIRMNYANWP
jgi:hypothetical protein